MLRSWVQTPSLTPIERVFMITLRMKTTNEFEHEFGECWTSARFNINVHDSGGCGAVVIPRHLVGRDIELNNDEFDFYKLSGIIRYFDPHAYMMTLITKEMIADDTTEFDKNVGLNIRGYRRNKNIYKIYLPKKKIRLNPSITRVLDDDVITSRMNVINL